VSALTAIKAQRAINARRAERLGMSVATVTAADFVTGNAADFARVCSGKGEVLELVRRGESESRIDFAARAKSLAAASGAPRLVFGGVDPAFDPEAVHEASQPPRGAISLLDGGRLHPTQARALRAILDRKRTVIRAGRRWGKSTVLIALAADEAIRGRPVGYFCPLFRIATPVFDALAIVLGPLIVSKTRGIELRLSTGGSIDIWSIETSTIIARGRKYARALLDEIAFTAATTDMGMLWRASISPTLIDLDGSVVVASTPWGTDPANWFFMICNDKTLGWFELHAKSEDNPLWSREVLEEEKRSNSPLVWRQEYEAEFTSLDAAALIDVTKLLQPDGEPWPEPERLDQVFAVIDSAIKTGAGADGTAALLCGVTRLWSGPFKRLWLLDYDIVQVTAGVIEPWFEGVVARAREIMGKRTLSAGPIYIEDAASGLILIEKYPQFTQALPHQWTSEGKDLRAYAVQAHFNGGQICITETCYRKTVSFKGIRINHLWTQLNSFVLGDKQASKRSDDLLDCAIYAASVVFRQMPSLR
jgi:hypothetical protein